MEDIEVAHREASMGMPTTRPVVEMTIPSAVDPTLAPKGKHVVQLFVQYAPYDMDPKFGNWADPAFTVRARPFGDARAPVSRATRRHRT